MPSEDDIIALKTKLEKKGLEQVKQEHASGIYGYWKKSYVEIWIRDEELQVERNYKRDNLQEKKQANKLSKLKLFVTLIGIVVTIILACLPFLFSN